MTDHESSSYGPHQKLEGKRERNNHGSDQDECQASASGDGHKAEKTVLSEDGVHGSWHKIHEYFKSTHESVVGGGIGEGRSRESGGGRTETGEHTSSRAATERESRTKGTSIAGTGDSTTKMGGDAEIESELEGGEESNAFVPARKEEGEEPGLRF
ncbi:sperm acrosomal protein FSA-ACR.1-like [Procambarus clarkii]|uniref:sperm acrosomal protein FSA-ACR.1-like n=1 Tax=Procambarus clarkii TaxID=6728 RepID=UPI0037448B28